MHNTLDDKIYIGGLTENVKRNDLEREFRRFGEILETWVAQTPPGFGFVRFASCEDAAKAIRVMDGKNVFGATIKVEAAKARTSGMRSRQNSGRRQDRSQGSQQNNRRQNSFGRGNFNRNDGGRKRSRPMSPPLSDRRLLAALPPLPSLRRSDVVETLDRLTSTLAMRSRRSPSPPAALRRRLDPSSGARSWSPPLPPLHVSSTRQLSPLRGLSSRRLSPPRSLGSRPLSLLPPNEESSRRFSPLRSLDSRRLSPLRSLNRLSPLRQLDSSRRLSPPPRRPPSPLSLLPRNLLLQDDIVDRLGRGDLRKSDSLRLGNLGDRNRDRDRDSLNSSWKRRLPSPPLLPLPRYRSRSPVGRHRYPEG